MIEVDGLSKIYEASDGRPVWAVQDVSFKVEAGRVFALIGANGAGKTTTLRILSTVLKPSAGSTRICGFDGITQAHEVRRRIGFLSGSTGVYDRMTPVEFLDYFAVLNGLDPEAARKRRDELIELLDMGAFCDRFCGVLSTGQKQKASIARALIHDPPVLIFDEPTSGLDILVARSVIGFIEKLKSEQRSILLSTHIMPEAEKLCDDMAIIHQGRLLTIGRVDELKEKHGCDSIQEIFYKLVDKVSENASEKVSKDREADA